jgi:hypothetical protein
MYATVAMRTESTPAIQTERTSVVLSSDNALAFRKIATIKKLYQKCLPSELSANMQLLHSSTTHANKKRNEPWGHWEVLPILLAFCLFGGCDDPARSKLVGTWGIETADTIMKRLGSDEPPAIPPRPDERDEPASAGPRMKIQFFRNGNLTTTTQMGRVAPEPKQGTWRMRSFDQETGTMRVECTLGLQVTEHEIQWIDDDTIKFSPPNLAGLNMKLKFQRMK